MAPEISSFGELIFHSILVLPLMFVGFASGIYGIYYSIKHGIVFSWNELFKKNTNGKLTPLQWLITGMGVIFGTVWMFFMTRSHRPRWECI